MSILTELSSSSASRAAISTGIVATAQSSAQHTPLFEVNPALYSLLAVVLALAGIYLARLVTIDQEDKRLGRKQTYRETGPLTWIAVLIVCPMIWQFDIAPQYASVIGLGVGYSVRLVLKIIGGATTSAARALARQAVDALDQQKGDTPALTAPVAPPPPPLQRPAAQYLPPDNEGPDGAARAMLIEHLDQVPSVPGKPSPPPAE
jgi:hypothetical protein